MKQAMGYWKRTNVFSTRFSLIASTLRATMYKQGERNLLENIKNGNGYEGIIERYEINSTDRNT